MGTVTIMASSLRKFCISSEVDLESNTIPGAEAPTVIEMILASTDNEIIPGIASGLNQFAATRELEFTIKTPPIAANIEPPRHQNGSPTSSKVLIQTPKMTKIPPMEHPVFIPNLSIIQLAGKARIGWRMGKINTFKVTTMVEY